MINCWLIKEEGERRGRYWDGAQRRLTEPSGLKPNAPLLKLLDDFLHHLLCLALSVEEQGIVGAAGDRPVVEP